MATTLAKEAIEATADTRASGEAVAVAPSRAPRRKAGAAVRASPTSLPLQAREASTPASSPAPALPGTMPQTLMALKATNTLGKPVASAIATGTRLPTTTAKPTVMTRDLRK